MASVTLFDVGACGCVSTCNVTINVLGCIGLLSGVSLTVSVYASSGGALLDTGTTTTGSIALSWAGVSGTYWVTTTGQTPRFASFAAGASLTCGHTHNINLTPGSGYACAGNGCNWPIATTLHLTDSTYGSITLTYSGTGWSSGSGGITYPGGTPCGCIALSPLSFSVTWTYIAGVIDVFWYIGGSGIPPSCPEASYLSGGSSNLRDGIVSVTNSLTCCTPSTSFQAQAVATSAHANCANSPTQCLYLILLGTVATLTLTE